MHIVHLHVLSPIHNSTGRRVKLYRYVQGFSPATAYITRSSSYACCVVLRSMTLPVAMNIHSMVVLAVAFTFTLTRRYCGS